MANEPSLSYGERNVIDQLVTAGSKRAIDIREALNDDLLTMTQSRRLLTRYKLGWLLTYSPASFYHMMAGMEDDGTVESWDEAIRLPEQFEVRERWYRLTQRGRILREHA